VQVTLAAGTTPFEVAGLNEQVTVRTIVGGGCSTVMTALVNDMSVIISVHDELGQSGAPGIGVVGEFVVTLNGVLPFLISLAGMDTLPVTVTGAGFCPGAWNVLPPGFPHVPVGFATAEMLTSTSPNPSPESAPDPVSVRPLSVKAGFEWSPFKCTLEANAGVVSTVARARIVTIAHILRNFFSPYAWVLFSSRPSSALMTILLRKKLLANLSDDKHPRNVYETSANDCKRNRVIA